MSLGVSISNMSSVEPQYSSLTVLFGVDDPVICLLLRSRPHPESTGRTMRVMFFDFSSVFNTIQPAPLMEKLTLSFLPSTVLTSDTTPQIVTSGGPQMIHPSLDLRGPILSIERSSPTSSSHMKTTCASTPVRRKRW